MKDLWVWHMGSSSLTRDWTHALFLGAQSLSHWTTREVPVIHGPFDGLKYPLSSSCMHAKSLQSYLTLCDTMDYSPPGSSVHEDSPVKNTGVGFHALLQGIFLTPVVTQVQKSENSSYSYFLLMNHNLLLKSDPVMLLVQSVYVGGKKQTNLTLPFINIVISTAKWEHLKMNKKWSKLFCQKTNLLLENEGFL